MSGIAGRFPPLAREDMNARQRAVADEIAAGPRGSLKGPFLVLIHNPELASCIQSVGEHLRFGTGLPKTLVEMAVLVTAHRWACSYEWFAHARIAKEAGVREEVIVDLAEGRAPYGMEPDEELVHRFSVETAWDGQPAERTLAQAIERFGRPGALDLIAIVGYYTLLAMTLNAAQVPVPEHPIRLQSAPTRRPSVSGN